MRLSPLPPSRFFSPPLTDLPSVVGSGEGGKTFESANDDGWSCSQDEGGGQHRSSSSYCSTSILCVQLLLPDAPFRRGDHEDFSIGADVVRHPRFLSPPPPSNPSFAPFISIRKDDSSSTTLSPSAKIGGDGRAKILQL